MFLLQCLSQCPQMALSPLQLGEIWVLVWFGPSLVESDRIFGLDYNQLKGLLWCGSAGLTIGVDDLSGLWSVLWQKATEILWRNKFSLNCNGILEGKMIQCFLKKFLHWVKNPKVQHGNEKFHWDDSGILRQRGLKILLEQDYHQIISASVAGNQSRVGWFTLARASTSWTSPSTSWSSPELLPVMFLSSHQHCQCQENIFFPLKPKHPRWDLAECQNSGVPTAPDNRTKVQYKDSSWVLLYSGFNGLGRDKWYLCPLVVPHRTELIS